MPLPHVAPGDPHTAAHNAERDVINTLDTKVIDATTAAKGLVELATNAETTTGTDAVRAVTPAGLKAVTDALPVPSPPAPAASTTVSGIVELATNAETTLGTDAVRAVTPAGLKAVTDALPPSSQPDATTSVKGIVELATNAETTAGTDAVRAVTPAGLKAVTDALPSGGGTIPDATDTTKGVVELATPAETVTGTDTVRAVTPAGLKAVTDALPVTGAVAFTSGNSGANVGYWIKVATYTHASAYRDTTHSLHVDLSPVNSATSTADLVVGIETGATLAGATVQTLLVTNTTGMFAATDFKLVKTQVSSGANPNIWELWVRSPGLSYTSLTASEIGRNNLADSPIDYAANAGAWQAAVSAGTAVVGVASTPNDIDTRYMRRSYGGAEACVNLGGVSGSIVLNANSGAIQTLTPSANIIITDFQNTSLGIGSVGTFTVIVKQGATVRTIDFSAFGAIWLTPQPTHVANKQTIYTMMNVNDGTGQWYISAVVGS